jgi:predicted component of type VI protein secretion system
VAAYRATLARDDERSGLASTVGLAFTDLDGRLDDARAQLAAGDFAAAARSTAEVEDRLDDSGSAAVARVLALLAVAAVLVALRRSGLRPPSDWASRIGPHTIGRSDPVL